MTDESATSDSVRRVPLDSTALAKVAADGIEATWDDVKGLATPLMSRMPVQVCHHPHAVLGHPDMSVTLGNAPDSRAVGLALGSPSGFPDMFKVTRRLHRGYLPILESQWAHDGLVLGQTVTGYLPHDARVKTGEETQYVLMRLTVTNNSAAPRQVPLFVYLGRGGDDTIACYQPFTAAVSRWGMPPLSLRSDGSALLAELGPVLAFNADKPLAAVFLPQVPAEAGGKDKPSALNNALRFDLSLAKGQTRTLDFVLADSVEGLPPGELESMRKVNFDQALAQAEERAEALLAPAMKLTTPDRRINETYKALALSSLSLQFRDPVNQWQMPRQSPSMGVWSWEFAHLAAPLFSIGLCQELDPSLKFFTDRQNGVGPKSANSQPRGDIKSAHGTFTGDNGSNWLWMNETGSILWALAERFRYSRDTAWLKAQWPSILAAWDWVQAERQTTRVNDDKGQKVRYWGLLPSGMPGDVAVHVYQFTFNDAFTWLGMSEIAAAAREAGFPDAQRLAQEADEYRQCILDVVHREEFVDEDTKLLFVPNMVFYRQTPADKRDPYWVADGPVQLFDVGLLDPKDKRFTDMVEYTRTAKGQPHSGILLGMAEHVGGGAEWYPNQTERSYFRCYLARGEVEKALLVLYSNLHYGMSGDTYSTTERFHTDDTNFTAFCPNGSGNGRNIDILRRMVIDEQEPGKLWLLRGCPRRWFEPGQSITVEKAPTLFGTMAIRVRSQADRITVDFDAPDRELPQAMILVVRSPKDRPIKSATVNGKPAQIEGETIALPRANGKLHVVIHRAKDR